MSFLRLEKYRLPTQALQPAQSSKEQYFKNEKLHFRKFGNSQKIRACWERKALALSFLENGKRKCQGTEENIRRFQHFVETDWVCS